MKKRYLKKQEGVVATDALIAILIITLFTGIITTLVYNIYLSNSSIKRMGQATGYITNIFEYADIIYYDNVTAQSLVNYFNNLNDSETVAKVNGTEETSEYTNAKYKININVVNYNEGTNKLDLLKTITISVSYNLGNREQTIDMRKIKRREKLIIPNSPELELIQLNNQNDEKIVPIKYINNKWQVTNKNDSTWYNYDNGYWAIALKTTQNLTVGQEVTLTGNELNIYAWIPRYAYNNLDETDVKLMYSTSNNTVTTDSNGYNLLESINSEEYDTTLFTDVNGDIETELRGRWISLNEIELQNSSCFSILNGSKYEIKNLEI